MFFTLPLLWTAHASEPDVTGTWATEFHIVSAAEVPILGSLRSDARTWIKMTVESADDGYRVHHEVCGSRVTGRGAKTVVPPAFTASMPRRSYPATVSANPAGWSWVADVQPIYVGFDPQCGAMPSSPGDPCVRDFDRDGHPGGTVRLDVPLFPAADVYIAQHTHVEMRGNVRPDGTIGGPLEVHRSTTRVLDATSSIYNRSPRTSVVPGASTFAMRRVADGASCDAVVTAWQ